MGTALEAASFDWADYRGESAETVEDWVKRFCTQFEGADLTWRTDYQQPFNKLPQNAPLTAELLRQTLEGVKQARPNSRAQLRAYNAYSQLAV